MEGVSQRKTSENSIPAMVLYKIRFVWYNILA
jgi:hypothetical protein